MYGLKEMLLQEQKYLEGVIAKISENKDSAPEGRLRISVDHGNVRYYNCISDRLGDYISRDNELLPRQLAQKAYNDSVIRTAEARSKLIIRCLKGYTDDEIEKLFDSLHPKRQELILPGERLILSFETEQDVLNSKIVTELVDKYLR